MTFVSPLVVTTRRLVVTTRRPSQTMHNCLVYIMHAHELIQCSLASSTAPRVRNRIHRIESQAFFVDAERWVATKE